MDITDISKVASRKRMNTDAEKLREKVSRETAKIIKLKVAQDTAYWDLKERLQQLEGAHERLQQNMVDVQMQHEAACAQYARELRLRPDTLNKVAGTRDMCAALEEYAARLRRGVARCRGDRAALAAAYAACGPRVRRLAADLQRQRDRAREAAALRGAEARRLAGALQQLGEARAAGQHATARLLQAEAAAGEAREHAARLQRERDAAAARHDARLQAARGDAEARAHELAQTRRDLQEATNTINNLENRAAAYVSQIDALQKVINDDDQRKKDMEMEISSMKQYLSKVEAEKREVDEQLNQSVQECRARSAAADELGATAAALQRRVDELDAAVAELQQRLHDQAAAAARQRDSDAERIQQLSRSAAAKDRELDANTGTIARLMADLKAEAEARGRTDAALGAARRQADAERDAARDAAARTDAALQAKEDELGAQIAIILDMRNEKERLQERIQRMQNTIDNIQKELTGRLAAPKATDAAEAEAPEQDGGGRDSSLYSFLSDGSVDGDALDPREVGRRFQAIARGCGAAGAGAGGAGGGEPGAGGAVRRKLQGSISLSQVKDDLKIKSRAFFKNKRFDNKIKKLK